VTRTPSRCNRCGNRLSLKKLSLKNRAFDFERRVVLRRNLWNPAIAAAAMP
jgi:hypothetical protein